VWFDADQCFFGFQLCYDKCGDEHAVAWRQDRGYSHCRVDAPEQKLGRKSAAMLVPGGVQRTAVLLDRFEVASREIDPLVRSFVLEKLQAWDQPDASPFRH
jgi:hypothetical protein